MAWSTKKPGSNYPASPRPECLDRPNDPEAYPEDHMRYRSRLRPIRQYVSERYAEEAAIVSRLGFIVPRTITQLQFEPVVDPIKCDPYFFSTVNIHVPKFEIPEHCVVRVRRNFYYAVTNRRQSAEDAKRDLAQYGLIYLLEHYRGLWLNRSPYQFYLNVNTAKPVYYTLFDKGFNDLCFKSPHDVFLMPLVEEPGWSTDQIRKIESRIRFFTTIFHDIVPLHKPVIRYACDPERSVYWDDFKDDVLLDERFPDRVFPKDCVSFKVLPSKEVSAGVTEQWLESFRHLGAVVCFELKSDPTSIRYQLSVDSKHAQTVQEHFAMYFPGFALLPADPEPAVSRPQRFCITAHLGTYNHGLKESRSFALDPYLSLFSLFDRSLRHEGIQVFFAPLQLEVLEPVVKLLYSPEQDKIRQDVKKKNPAWLAAVTLYSDDQTRLERLKTFLTQFENAEQPWKVSAVQPVAGADYKISPWMLVSTSELAGLVHYPAKEIDSNRLERTSMKSKLPPENFTTSKVRIGESEARGATRPIALPESVRDRHLYIVGKSGMGKSTLIANAVIANFWEREGCCVIDPHGDLVATGSHPLLDYVPKHRIPDTIYFNAADKDYPLALNMLAARPDDELSLLADNLLVTFRRLSDASWSPYG